MASSSIHPLRSANSTVTCRRSPSRVALEVRIFSARCLGVYLSGELGRSDVGTGLKIAPARGCGCRLGERAAFGLGFVGARQPKSNNAVTD